MSKWFAEFGEEWRARRIARAIVLVAVLLSAAIATPDDVVWLPAACITGVKFDPTKCDSISETRSLCHEVILRTSCVSAAREMNKAGAAK